MTFHDESHFFLSRIFRWQEKKGGIHTTHYDNDSLLVCFLHFRIIITCVCSCGRCAVWSFNNATHNCNLIWRVNETQPKYTLCRFMNVIKLDFWFSVSYEQIGTMQMKRKMNKILSLNFNYIWMHTTNSRWFKTKIQTHRNSAYKWFFIINWSLFFRSQQQQQQKMHKSRCQAKMSCFWFYHLVFVIISSGVCIQ